VTLFLVNGQTETRKLKDSAWLFQPELSASGVDNAPVFICRTLSRDPGKMDPATLAEEQAMNMLYRERLEFAVGHGVSVRAEGSACGAAHSASPPQPCRLSRLRKPRHQTKEILGCLPG
jgi:hypothetical protein